MVGCELLFSGTFPMESVDVGFADADAPFAVSEVVEGTLAAFRPNGANGEP